MALSLWLLRHGRAEVPPGTCYGQLDVPAETAHTRCSAAAFWSDWLREHASQPDWVWCSPLRRTRQLADALHEVGLTVPALLKPDLAEMDFGAWEGASWQRIGKDPLTKWTDDFWYHPAGGGESVSELVSRVSDALAATKEAARVTALAQRRPVNVLWVTHAGVIRAVDVLLHMRAQFPLQAQDWPVQAPEPGGWTRFELN